MCRSGVGVLLPNPINRKINESKYGGENERKSHKCSQKCVTGIGRGVTQQNRMQFGLMAQNEDSSAAQAHCNMHVVTTMKRAELTQKMIEMQISMRENMGDGAAKEKTYESIQDLFDK